MTRARVSRLLIAAAMVVLTACQADVTVQLDVEESGGGTVAVDVVFDQDSQRVLGEIAQNVRVSDLERAGWRVETNEGDDGSTSLAATKAVANRDQWQAVLDEIAGPGVFTDVGVSADDEFARNSQRVSYAIDLSDGWDLFSDQGVTDALGGEPFGAPLDTLTGGRTIDEIVDVEITTTVVSEAGTTPVSRTEQVRFDGADPTVVTVAAVVEQATATVVRWISMALFSLAALATVLAVTGIFLQRRADRLRPLPTPASLASRVPGAPSASPAPRVVASKATGSTASSSEQVRLVVLDPLTVFYDQTKSIDQYVLPFVREHNGRARADAILESYEDALAGLIDTETFWESCGILDSTWSVDDRFVATRTLRAGAAGFLSEMQKRRIPVAATTVDHATWSNLLRDRDRLSGVWPWLVSSEVGTTTADGAMFEVLRRESGIAHAHCLYVDTNLDSLDAARELGMKTALFDTGDLELPDVVGHPVVKDFKALFGSKKPPTRG